MLKIPVPVYLQSVSWFLMHYMPGPSSKEYANCAQPVRAKLEAFMSEEMKYCGLLKEGDLKMVQERIIASGMLTVTEINTFFYKK